MQHIPFRCLKVILILFIVISCTGPRTLFHPQDLPEHLKWVTVENIPIVYTDQGRGDTLLILSSFPLGTESWSELAKLLSHSFRVIVVESPWLLEPHALGGDFSSEYLLQIYRKFIRMIGIKRVHVMGVGEGGALAVAFGHHFPEHVITAISINGFEGVFWSEKTQEMLDIFYSSSEEGIINLLKSASLRYKQQVPSHEVINRLMRQLEEKERLEAMHARMNDFIQDIKSLYITAMIEYIHFPVLLIHSENDALLPKEYAEWSSSRIDNVQYQTLQEAGHFAFLDRPKKVAEIVHEFLLRYPITKKPLRIQ